MPELLPLPLPPDDGTLHALLDAALPLLGIAVDPAWRSPIAQNLAAISAAARLVLEFPLDDTLEPAPRFEP